MRSFTIRRMSSVWPLVGCLAASVLVTSALVSALVSFYSDALPAAVARQLAASDGMSIAISGAARGSLAAQVAGVRAKLTTAFGIVGYQLYSGAWSDSLASGLPQRHGQQPVIVAAAVGGIAARASLTSGAWPAAPRPGRPVPAALPAAAAAALGVHTGSVLSLRDLTTGRHVELLVTGLYRPKQPASGYWRVDLIGTSGVLAGSGFVSYGPAVVSPVAFASAARPTAQAPLAASQLSLVALPRVSSITTAMLNPLARRLSATASQLDAAGQLTARTSMPQTLSNAAAGLAAARSLVLISGLELLLLAAAALGLAGRLLASYREGETALLTARGAGRRQLIWPSVAEAVLAIGATAALGALAGSWLSGALLAHLTGQPRHPVAPAAVVWLSAAVLAVFCLGIVVWPAARVPGRVRLRLRLRGGRSLPIATLVSAGADIALIVLALLAVRELRTYSAAARVAGRVGLDPVIAVAPALALAGLAVVPLRLLPAATRGLERLTARGRRLGYAMANWEISRRPLRQTGPALLVVLAVGASTLALTQYQSWRQSVHDQAAFDVGTPVRVQLISAEPLGGAARLGRLPGVTAAMPVSEQPLAGTGQLLVLTAPAAARTVLLRSDLASQPAARLFRAIDVPPAGLVLPGRPARIGITASMAAYDGGTTRPGSATESVSGTESAAAGSGPAAGSVSATLTVQDADGIGYAIRTTAMPADGKPHLLTARLAAAGAVYPLRLLGISVGYTMRAYPPTARARSADQRAVLQLSGVSVSPAASGPLAEPVAAGRAFAQWAAQVADPGLASVIAVLGGATDGAMAPAITSAVFTGSAERIVFRPGYGPLNQGQAAPSLLRPPPGPAEVSLSIPAGQPVPVIATASYAAANGLRDGSTFAVPVAGEQVSCRLVATVAAFPGGAALVAGQVAVQDALAGLGAGGTLPATQWWLNTRTGLPPAGLPAGSAVRSASSVSRELARDPESAAPVQAAAAVAAAAALLAALGFCVSVAASARERRPQRALLGALGVHGTAQARLFCLEEALVAVPAAGFGLLIGVGLGHLLVRALTLTATGGLPVPPVLVIVPWGWVSCVAAGLAAIPVLAAAISALGEPDAAAELRASEAIA